METSVEDFARCDSDAILPPQSRRGCVPARLAATGLMGQASGAALARLDGTPVEYRLTGEDRRAILLAQTLTELEIADPSDWERAERNPSGYVLATL
ncbi:MAG: hypothetical protein ACRD11_11775, partial [Terriglobia bacterium]